MGPIGGASFALKLNYISGVFIIRMSNSGARTMLVSLPAREDTVEKGAHGFIGVGQSVEWAGT